jgi:hypothetical protein
MSAPRPSFHLHRLLGGSALALLLVAASWAPLALQPEDFDPQQFRANQERWRALPEARRAELRGQWEVFSLREAEDRERTLQHMDVLRAMTATLSRIHGREPTAAELEARLAEIQEVFSAWLVEALAPPTDADSEALLSAAEGEIATRIGAFLDGLVEVGRLDAVTRTKIGEMQPSLLIREGLALLAAEQLRARDGGALVPGAMVPGAMLAADPASTDPDDPQRVLDRLDQQQVNRDRAARTAKAKADGAARSVPGGASSQRERFKMTHTVARLQRLGYTPDEISAIINLPQSALEARLDELFGGD